MRLPAAIDIQIKTPSNAARQQLSESALALLQDKVVRGSRLHRLTVLKRVHPGGSPRNNKLAGAGGAVPAVHAYPGE